MDSDQLQAIIQAAVGVALATQQLTMQATIDELKSSIATLKMTNEPAKVEEYVDCVIDGSVCNEGLDVVKSLSEFSGDKKNLTFRDAAERAYKVFESAPGSSKHYQLNDKYRKDALRVCVRIKEGIE